VKLLSRFFLLAVLIAAGAWLWTIIFPGPEKIVRHRLAAVAKEASFPAGESPLIIAARSESLAGYFNTNVEVNVDLPEHGWHDLAGREENNSISRGEITQLAAGARARVSSLHVEFPDVNVKVGPDRQSAVVEAAAEVQAAGQKDPDVQVLKFTFQKIEGDWLITRIESVRAHN
jgi:hypothetical protein